MCILVRRSNTYRQNQEIKNVGQKIQNPVNKRDFFIAHLRRRNQGSPAKTCVCKKKKSIFVKTFGLPLVHQSGGIFLFFALPVFP